MKSINNFAKTSVLGLSLLTLLSSCGSDDRGYVTGVKGRKPVFQEDPFGMVYVPTGAFHMGPGDQDVPNAQNASSRMVSVQAFYMDQTEITNNEYRQFVQYVADSVTRKKMSETDEEFLISEDKDGNPLDKPILNWKKKIDSKNEDHREALKGVQYQGEEAFNGPELDIRLLNYKFDASVDYKSAAADTARVLTKGRQKHLYKEDMVNIYPDTLVWVRDYTYSFNEPMTETYFTHPAYDEYPVVGVTWKQANAFCHWRTKMRNDYLKKNKRPNENPYRLPTEAEWEYASRGGAESNPYPWGGPYVRNAQGCFLANFKPLRGVYADDGGFHTVPVSSYNPNGYGLYCMSGNVAEWTATHYDPSTYTFMHDLNPDYKVNAKKEDPITKQRKVIRGGSWKDVAYYLQCGSRDYEFQDTTKSYVGFRCVTTSLPRKRR